MGIGQDRHLNGFKDYYDNIPEIGDEFIRSFNNNNIYVVVGIHIDGISSSESYYCYELMYKNKDFNTYRSCHGSMSKSSFLSCIILNKFKSIQLK